MRPKFIYDIDNNNYSAASSSENNSVFPKDVEDYILRVCPGINVDYNNYVNSENRKKNHHHSISGYSGFMGSMIAVRKCFAGDPEVRNRAAAAGGLTGLGEYLLSKKYRQSNFGMETGPVEFIHHIRGVRCDDINKVNTTEHNYTTTEESSEDINKIINPGENNMAIPNMIPANLASVCNTKYTKLSPLLSIPHESYTKSDLLVGSQSRYGPAAPLANIVQLLEFGKPFVFVGKPCDINGLRNLGKYDKRVNELVKFTMTISCGMQPDMKMYQDWLTEEKGLKEEDVEEFRYRGCGCPGYSPYAKMKSKSVVDSHATGEEKTSPCTMTSSTKKSLVPASKEEAFLTYHEFFYEQKWSCQLRCKLCPDFLGEQADVTVMDCWDKGIPKAEGLEGPGFVLVVSRSEKGERLVQEAILEKFLVDASDVTSSVGSSALGQNVDEFGHIFPSDHPLSGQVTFKDVIYTQPHQITRKMANYARQLAVEEAGVINLLGLGVKHYESASHTVFNDEKVLTPEDINYIQRTMMVTESTVMHFLNQVIENYSWIEEKDGDVSICGNHDKNMQIEIADRKYAEDVLFKRKKIEIVLPDFVKNFLVINFLGCLKRIEKGKEENYL